MGGTGCVGGDQLGKRAVVFCAERTIERERAVAPPAEKIPVAVAREIDGDAVQPRRERRIAAEAAEGAVSPNKSVLRDFLGIGAVAEIGERDGEHFFPIALHDFNKRAGVAGVEPLNQPGVVRRFLGGGGRTPLSRRVSIATRIWQVARLG